MKIQYPGVSASISSDLALVKPIAIKMFNINGKGSDQYFKEVENKLLDETDYLLEIKQSSEISKACSHIPHLLFPAYYPELSSERIITMDWMGGIHLSVFTAQNTDQESANRIGQTLWDFYMFQIHQLKKVHADPHPGNFLVSEEGELIALDFGCVKHVPEEFYVPYFELAQKENLGNPSIFSKKLVELEIIKDSDSEAEKSFFTEMFHDLLTHFTMPFQTESFDFSNEAFFAKFSEMGAAYAKSTELRNMNGNRGSKHFIYINRTFFGLYNLLHSLKASNIKINNHVVLP